MMNNRLRKIFFTADQEIEKFKQQLLQEQKKSIEHRNKEIRLVRHNDILFYSEPFQSFPGDCAQCSNYLESYDFVTGGDCILHNISCGYGYICKDNDSTHNDDWEEFIKIKNSRIREDLVKDEKTNA